MGMGKHSMHTPAKTVDGKLTNDAGMTLYTFDRDMPGSGKSACNGPCATNWPPLMAKDGDRGSGNFSVITRDDGKAQWAYQGKPLYTWVKDQKPGDMTGDGFNNAWRVAKP
jgi:predicted lipoprotein with Yx(FWY)xxD motif